MSRFDPRLVAVAVLILAGSRATAVAGQRIRPSQFGAVTQRIGAAEVVVRYRRPVARGRTLLGNVVRYGRPWTPGADSATTIALSDSMMVAGRPVAAGVYSLWLIPEADGPWTLILSRRAEVFHTPYPTGDDAMRAAVDPQEGDHMETLAFYFPLVDADSAVLQFHWGRVVLPIPIRLVRPNVPDASRGAMDPPVVARRERTPGV